MRANITWLLFNTVRGRSAIQSAHHSTRSAHPNIGALMRGALTTPSDTATDTDEYGVRYTIPFRYRRIPSLTLWLPSIHPLPPSIRGHSLTVPNQRRPLTFSFSPQALPLSHLPLPALCPDPRSTLLRLLPPYPLLEKSISPLSLYTRGPSLISQSSAHLEGDRT